jgi:hypothetical protein
MKETKPRCPLSIVIYESRSPESSTLYSGADSVVVGWHCTPRRLHVIRPLQAAISPCTPVPSVCDVSSHDPRSVMYLSAGRLVRSEYSFHLSMFPEVASSFFSGARDYVAGHFHLAQLLKPTLFFTTPTIIYLCLQRYHTNIHGKVEWDSYPIIRDGCRTFICLPNLPRGWEISGLPCPRYHWVDHCLFLGNLKAFLKALKTQPSIDSRAESSTWSRAGEGAEDVEPLLI